MNGRRPATRIRTRKPTLETLERRDLPSFVAPLLVPTGNAPVSIVAADFNGDNELDLATGNAGGTVSIILAAADGTFRRPATYSNTTGLRALAVAEFNGDGKLDIATTHPDSSIVRIRFGNGDGTFQDAVTAPAGFQAHGVAAADVDGDGDNDMAVTSNAINGGVAVILNDGNGTFQFTGFAVGSNPVAVVTSEFNGDSIVDLAVLGSSLQLVLGNGDGSFQLPVLIGTDFGKALLATELDGDGIADIVVTKPNDSVSVLRGNGDGTFAAPKAYPAGTNPTSIAAADVDGDSDTDIVVGNAASTATVLRNQNGALGKGATYQIGGVSAAVTLGDFNNDGSTDLATAIPFSDSVTLLMGTAGGTFNGLASYLLPPGADATGVVAGDVGGDGALDLTVSYLVHIIPNFLSADYLTTFEGSGSGEFSDGNSILTDGRTTVLGDLNRDGFQDFVVGRQRATVHLGGPSGFVQAQQYKAGRDPDDVALGDFNGDGVLDLVVPNKINIGAVSVLLGNSDGTFGTLTSFRAGNKPNAVTVADFNGDGFLDIAAVSANVNILLGNGDGTFQPAVAYNSDGAAVAFLTDDLSSDGIPDIAVATTNGVRVLINNGDGTFKPPINTGFSEPLALASGDFNSDGKADLAVNGGQFPDYGVRLLLGNGNGTFRRGRIVVSGPPRPVVKVADVNGDGHQDIVATVLSLATSTIHVMLGNGDGTFYKAAAVSAGSNSLAIDDVDNDGYPDLVSVANSLTAVRRGNGDGTFDVPERYVLGPALVSVAVADFNGDGFRDMVGVGKFGAHVLLNAQDGLFSGPRVYDGGMRDAGDFNGDGLLDLAGTSSPPPRVTVLIATGAGGVYPRYREYLPGGTPVDAAVVDVNNDGHLDVVANVQAAISVLLGNGNGTFKPVKTSSSGPNVFDLVTGDFNEDGNLDVMVATELSPGTVRLMLGNGDGTFAAPVTIRTRTGETADIQTADFNGDGHLDFAMIAPSAVAIRLGNGNGTFTSPLLYAVLASGSGLTVGDFNGDGFVDIAAVGENNLAILLNAADWPPLPIGDGSPVAGGLAPLNIDSSDEKFRPVATNRAPITPLLTPGDETETPILSGSEYASRHITRVARAEKMDTEFELFLTD